MLVHQVLARSDGYGLSVIDLPRLLKLTVAYFDLSIGADETAWRKGAALIGLEGWQATDDRRPPKTFAVHNAVLRVLGALVAEAGMAIPVDAACADERCVATVTGITRPRRFRVPGYPVCHWHGASVDPDDVVLATMMREIGAE